MKQSIHFSKMHGLGNDFILVDAVTQRIDVDTAADMAKTICDRNFGIGADGLILVLKSNTSDIQMRVFNADGSEPEMCGNGLRCFAKFVWDNKILEKDVFSVETIGGIKVPALMIQDGIVTGIEIDMGIPDLTPKAIPVEGPKSKQIIDEPITVDGQTFNVTCVSMGNPHAVVFLDSLTDIDLETLGPKFEHHPWFPKRVNTEFVQVLDTNEAVMVVWERGAGETLACGTGACATVVAGVLTGRLDRKATVHLPGGDLLIDWQTSDDHVLKSGPAETVYTGQIQV